MNAIPVLVWGDRPDLVSDLERSQAHVVVVRRCDDLAEVLAVIGAGITSHAVLAGPTVEITTAFTEALTRAGGRGVCLVSHPSEEPRLTRMGLRVLPWDASVAEIVAALEAQATIGPDETTAGVPPDAAAESVPRMAPPLGAWRPAPPAGQADPGPWSPPVAPSTASSAGSGETSAEPGLGHASGTDAPGRITVVWGTHGAPGRSTVALNLAVEEATLGSRVCLVDADTHAASLGPLLGLMDETAGLVRLTRAVQEGEFDPLPDTAAHARVRVGHHTLRFTSGLPRPQRWAEISAEGLRTALSVLERMSDHVIVDVAAAAGQDDDLAMDTFAPQRNDATVAALGMAHRVIVVGTADAIGLPRLIRACEELPERIGPDTRVEVVVNKVRAGCSGPRPEASVASAWRRFGPRQMVPHQFLPWDLVAADAAVLAGRALAEAAPRSALRKGIAALVLGAPEPSTASAPDSGRGRPSEGSGRRKRTRGRSAGAGAGFRG
ncbi:MAG: AAA family ATPase [Galactobacter sp.]